jgi:hypothetical protein
MSLEHAPSRKSKSAKRGRKPKWGPALEARNPHQILTFPEWCLLNGISPRTGRRILDSGSGPAITQLSANRIGISVAANAAWQASRVRT